MKKFEFGLQKILEYKIHIQKNEKDILLSMKQKHNMIVELQNQTMQEYQALKKRRINESLAGISICDLVLLDAYIKQTAERLLLIEQQKKQLELAIDKQIKVLLTATQDKTSLEKLKEKTLKNFLFEENKQTERFIEEISSYNMLVAANS